MCFESIEEFDDGCIDCEYNWFDVFLYEKGSGSKGADYYSVEMIQIIKSQSGMMLYIEI